MKATPFFSVIIPTYNRKDFLSIAIDSVLQQTFDDFELLIVDDGSGDGTRKLIKGITDNRLRYVRQQHKGVSAARNKGIRQARGKFICFLDSDDRFRRQKLEITHQYIKTYPRCKIFHTEELWYRSGKILPQKKYHKKPEKNIFENALRICCISISTAAIHRNVFAKAGLFDVKLPACEDYDFWLRVASRFPVKLIPNVLTIKEGGHPDQGSKKYPAMDTFRIYAIEKLIQRGSLNKKQRTVAALELKRKVAIYIKGAQKRQKFKEVERYQRLVEKLDAAHVA